MTEEKPTQVKEPVQIARQRNLLNRWSFFALLIVSALFTFLYVSNVIGVRKLLDQKELLNKRIDSIRTYNETLKTETYRLQSAQRITRIAQEKLGLIPPKQAPTVIDAKKE
ncbi:MAG: FtsL-like putative cell division protein [Candidatus Kapaibacterium sp.]